MKEIEANKVAWGLLAKDQYKRFKKSFLENKSQLSYIVEKELGYISGKSIVHLQCNTGADSIALAQKGAIVTGIDIVPENIFYAKKLSHELGIKNVDFIECNILELKDKHNCKYDMVFTTEGVLYWLPDLNRWAETVKHLLKESGVLYLLDGHPFSMIFDEEKMKNSILEIKYPYFVKEPEREEVIGEYTGKPEESECYGWMYNVSEIINALIKAGLTIEFFNEYDTLYFNLGDMKRTENGQWHYQFFDKKIPFTFSIKARF